MNGMFCLTAREFGQDVEICYPNTYDHQYEYVKRSRRFYEYPYLRYIAFVGRTKRFKTCFNIGACFANHALYFSRFMNCTVDCFEPNRNLIELIAFNLKTANADFATHNIALGDGEGTGETAPCEDNIGASRFVQGAGGAGPTRICALDRYAGEKNLRIPDFISVDTEGYEYKILEGARSILADNNVEIFIEIAKDNMSLCAGFFHALGYRRIVRIGKNFHYSKNCNTWERMLFVGYAHFEKAKRELRRFAVPRFST